MTFCAHTPNVKCPNCYPAMVQQPVREDKSTKPDYTLIPIEVLDRIESRLAYGVQKYGKRDDWKEELKERGIHRYKQSLLRHTLQYIDGQTDEDHLGAILANATFIAWWEAQSSEVLQESERPHESEGTCWCWEEDR